jgi:hypothetical protein
MSGVGLECARKPADLIAQAKRKALDVTVAAIAASSPTLDSRSSRPRLPRSLSSRRVQPGVPEPVRVRRLRDVHDPIGGTAVLWLGARLERLVAAAHPAAAVCEVDQVAQLPIPWILHPDLSPSDSEAAIRARLDARTAQAKAEEG